MQKKKSKGNSIVGLVVFMVLFVGVTAVAQDIPSIVEISGRVTDESSGRAIENATVKTLGSDVSAVLTNAEGKYKFYLVGQKEHFTLKICKTGYTARSSRPMDPNTARGKIVFDAALEPDERHEIKLKKTDFISGKLTGRVTGLEDNELCKNYKVLVYVLTNQWYIHPYAENKEGRGYAGIKPDGSWSIKTVNRENYPFRLAILVVPRNYVPPSVIQVGEDAEQSLRAQIGENLAASQIIPAPENGL